MVEGSLEDDLLKSGSFHTRYVFFFVSDVFLHEFSIRYP